MAEFGEILNIKLENLDERFGDSNSVKGQPEIRIVETTINTVTGARTERDILSFIPAHVVVNGFEYYSTLEITCLQDDAKQLFEAVKEFGEREIDKNLISRKEIKFTPNILNTNVFMYVCGHFSVQWAQYNMLPMVAIEFDVTKNQGYVINNGVQLSLAHGKKAFEDISVLSDEDKAYIDSVHQLQMSDKWCISSPSIKEEAVEADVMAEINSVFDALTDTEKQIIGINELKIIKGSQDSGKELEQMIGMDNIKHEIEILEAKLKYHRDMQKIGYFSEDISSMHMCFLGAPGTGKTTVARIITGVLSKYGYVKKNKCIEINARQLIGSYVGQTPFRTATIIKAARGGVLFIDEAYTLFSGSNNDTYAAEAIAQLLKQMEDERGNLIVILAGYNNDMQRFLDANEGMRSRINKYINFEDYTVKETMDIFLLLLRKERFFIGTDALSKVLLLVKKCCMSSGFSNGRFVRNLYEKILEEHSYTVYKNNVTGPAADIITIDDITDNLCNSMIQAQR